jgi:LEA14-like dessication related protein
MNMTNTIRPLLFGISILFLFNSCIDYKEVEFLGVTDYSINKLDTEEVRITLSMKIKNPNNYNIKIKKSSFDLYLNGKKLGETKMLDDVKLGKNRSQVHDVVFDGNVEDITQGVFSSLGILLGGTAKLRVKGKLKAKAYGIGKKFDVDFAQNIKASDLKF